ncbi:hypothetical protein GCM10025857_26410 [Alicyclobacillus contaminans]|uniref:aspartyl-phosphate phosphatase Spo0E family protein n=1 Tax=Alicyclobacillus contaminans TaxID=392016 RepID=UPI0004026CA2|nr:aspartyl-phosphate phosphatase Spo0E family protein [Alicyclobacillus contaminans]GMA51284.1 hypothetical protein GCM10025857_26410 [Alicyclobacillus contaminans]
MNSPTNPRIEMLRAMLYEVAARHQGNLLHPQVIAASQRLDAEITHIMTPTSKTTSASAFHYAV